VFDDTLFRRWGRKVFGAFWTHDGSAQQRMAIADSATLTPCIRTCCCSPSHETRTCTVPNALESATTMKGFQRSRTGMLLTSPTCAGVVAVASCCFGLSEFRALGGQLVVYEKWLSAILFEGLAARHHMKHPLVRLAGYGTPPVGCHDELGRNRRYRSLSL
jgi:hypothetical protein